jgi:hypothetical protein
LNDHEEIRGEAGLKKKKSKGKWKWKHSIPEPTEHKAVWRGKFRAMNAYIKKNRQL